MKQAVNSVMREAFIEQERKRRFSVGSYVSWSIFSFIFVTVIQVFLRVWLAMRGWLSDFSMEEILSVKTLIISLVMLLIVMIIRTAFNSKTIQQLQEIDLRYETILVVKKEKIRTGVRHKRGSGLDFYIHYITDDSEHEQIKKVEYELYKIFSENEEAVAISGTLFNRERTYLMKTKID
jgi:hypothetical protein